jgi:uncharacterized damage-inducible protein DinB
MAPSVTLDSTIASARTVHNTVTGLVIKTAAMVPEDKYSYRPTPEVRAMGQLFAHIAKSNTLFCSMASGVPAPEGPALPDDPTSPEVATKAALEAALAASVAFCDGAFAAVTSANGAEEVDLFGTMYSRVGAFGFNNGHNYEHYGNLVTYLRLNGMVPPSSGGGM